MTTTTATRTCIPGCGRPATSRGDYPYLCWAHTPKDQDRYPVIVEYTHRHVVWVAADDHKAAVASMQSDAYEHTNDQETLYEADWKVSAPEFSFEWDDIYEGGYYQAYQGLNYEAHVEAYRAHLRAIARAHLDATVENERRDIVDGRLTEQQRRTCEMCPAWLEPGHEDSFHHKFSVRMAERVAA